MDPVVKAILAAALPVLDVPTHSSGSSDKCSACLPLYIALNINGVLNIVFPDNVAKMKHA